MKNKVHNTVENTTKAVREEPIIGLMTAMPGGIEASEARGQRQFEESDLLPSRIDDPMDSERGTALKILESWGFTFGKTVGGDSLFQQAKLPEGWKKVGTGHSMWTDIVDEQGRKRASVFYKAAFYDRSAFMSISSRYSFSHEFEKDRTTDKDYMHGPVRGVWKEGDRVLFAGPWRKDEKTGGRYEAYEQAREDAVAWHKDNLPQGLVEQWAAP